MSNNLSNRQDNPFIRSNSAYPQDEIRILKPTHKFMGQITQTTTQPATPNSNPTTIRIVDDAVMVASIDDKTRQIAKDHFSSLTQTASLEQNNKHTNVKYGNAKTIFGIVLSAGGTLALATLTLPLLIPSAAIACGIASTVLGIRQVAKNESAIHHIQEDINVLNQRNNEWNDPIESVIYQRQHAGCEGFQYVLDQNLKNKSIHPEEVRALWLRDFHTLLTKHLPANQIFTENLMGKRALEYSFDGCPLPDLEVGNQKLSSSLLNMIASRYQECHQAYNHFTTDINRQTNDLNTQHSSLLSQISSLRTQWTLPALRMYNFGLEEAEHLCNSSLATYASQRDFAISECKRAYHYEVNDPCNTDEMAYKAQLDSLCRDAITEISREYEINRCSIQQAYERDRQMCSFLFNQSKLVVDAFFDNRIRQLDSEVGQAKQMINQQLQNGFQHFDNLLDRILHPINEVSLQQQLICTPPVTKNWRLSNLALEPSWHDVYGQIPSFQSSFSSNISENSWNLFWGNNGLGRYARCPTNTWDRVDTTRSSFPFQQQWFNLHSVQQPRPRMYCRPVVVPQPSFQTCRPPAGRPVRPEPARPIRPIRPIRQERPEPARPVRPTPRQECPAPRPPTPEVRDRDTRGHVPVGNNGNRQPQCPAPKPEPVRPQTSRTDTPSRAFAPTERRPDNVVNPQPQCPAPRPEPVRPPTSRTEVPSRAFAPTERRPDSGQARVQVPAQRTELVGNRVRAGTARR